MSNFYCEYCGANFSNASSLLSQNCIRHPNGKIFYLPPENFLEW